MDGKYIVLIVVVVAFAAVAAAAFFLFRQRAKVTINGPFHTALKVDASNQTPPPTPAVSVEDAVSRRGGIIAEDRTGRGAQLKKIDVAEDIRATSEKPSGDPSPKQ